MKTKYFILAAMGIIAGATVLSCKINKEKIVKDVKDDLKQAKQGFHDALEDIDKEWRQFKDSTELKFNDNEKKIDKFKSKIKNAGKAIKTKYEKTADALEQRNIALKKNISEYKYENKDKWEVFKQAFNRDMDAVGKAINGLFAKK